jgi:hypothetical protein
MPQPPKIGHGHGHAGIRRLAREQDADFVSVLLVRLQEVLH